MRQIEIFGRIVKLAIFDIDGTVLHIGQVDGLVPGVKEFFQLLERNQTPRCVCTLKLAEKLRADLIEHEISPEDFEVIITGCPKVKKVGKKIGADVEALYPIFQRFPDISPSEMAYFGDLEDDFDLARSLGIPFIGILSGNVSREEFISMGVPPNRIITSYSEILLNCKEVYDPQLLAMAN